MTKSKRRIRERDLRSDNPNIWAAAVVHSSNNGCHNPYCGADGFCHNGGTCFSPLSSGSVRRDDLADAIDDMREAYFDALHQVDELKKEVKRLSEAAVSRNELLGIERQLEELKEAKTDGSAKEE